LLITGFIVAVEIKNIYINWNLLSSELF